MKYLKYLMKAFLHWLCVYIGLIAIVWFLFAVLVVKIDGSYMWTEVDACAIKALAIILSYYVTREAVGAYELAASIVPCRDCCYLYPLCGVNPKEAENDEWVGRCTYLGKHLVRAGEYCIHGRER